MNAKLLDSQLRKLTNEEIEARDGKEKDYSGFQFIEDSGKNYFLMTKGENIYHPYISFMPHTRFIPVKPHVHKWIELGYMYSGSCIQLINGEKQVKLEKGQVIFLDADCMHSIGNTGEDDIMINFLFEKEYFNERFFSHFSKENILLQFLLNAISEKKIHDNFILFHSERSTRIQLFMQELIIEFLGSPAESSVDVIDNLVNLIFLELVKVYHSDLVTSQLNLGKGKCMAVMKYIEANYRNCTLESVAEMFNMNPNYLSGMLKKNTGYSFKEMIQHYRFIYVTTMLKNTAQPVDQIILWAGYENTTYFYKKFREQYGCTPKQYRKEHQSVKTS